MSFIKALPSILSKTAAYTVSTNDGDNVQVNTDASSGAVTITLYAASTNAGKIVTVKKTDSSVNAVTIDGNASETIDGATTLVLAKQYDSATLTCNGTNWTSVAVAGQTFNGQTISSAASFTGSLGVAGLLTVSGFGTHSFVAGGTGDQLLYVQNSTAGIGNYATVGVGNDNDGQALTLRSYSTTYSTSGLNIAASSLIRGNQSAGLSIAATNASGAIRFYSGGTTERVKIDSNGAMTKPAQPAFLAIATASQNNVTGDGTSYTVLWGTEIFDQASNFASSTFTAPVTGRYQLNVTVGLTGMLTTHTNAYIQLVTSNRSYLNQIQRASNFIADDTFVLTLSVLADMDAADTASVILVVSNATKVVDIMATSYSTFSGYLAC